MTAAGPPVSLIHLFEVRQLQHAPALLQRQVRVCREPAQNPENVGPPIAYEILILAAARNQDVKQKFIAAFGFNSLAVAMVIVCLLLLYGLRGAPTRSS